MTSPRRGISLGTTLLISLIVFIISVTLVVLVSMSLNMAQGFYAQTQAEMLARSAVTQFIRDHLYTLSSSVVNATPGPQPVSSSLVSPYVPSINPAQGLPGTVSVAILSDNTAGNTVDANGVPPYSAALQITATVNNRTFGYEAILQQSWPYAVTAPGQLLLMGGLSWPTTSVTGGLCVFSNPLMPSAPGNAPVIVSNAFLNNLDGGFDSISQFIAVPDPVSGALAELGPGGNLLTGRADFYLTPGNAPYLPQVEEVPGTPASTWAAPQKTSTVTASTALINEFTQDVLTPQAAPPSATDLTQSSSLAAYTAGPIAQSATIYLMEQSLNLSSGYNVVNGNLANLIPGFLFWNPDRPRDVPADVKPASGTTLHLENCILEVDGSLDLSGTDHDTLQQLFMSNATLIVTGNFVLRNARFDTGSGGALILCQNLVMSAKGTVKGLIIAQNGALIMPGNVSGTPTGVVLKGGIVSGGNTTNFGMFSHSPGSPPTYSSLTATANAVWGATIEYQPRWLKRLQGLGMFTLQSLKFIP